MNPESLHNKNILILGASGFVGSVLTKILHEEFPSCQVTLLQHHSKINGDKFKVVNGDLNEISRAQLLGLNPDIIIHLARINAIRFGAWGRRFAALRGYYANKKLLKNLSQLNKKVKLVYLSGSLMYGKGLHDESAPLNPVAFARQYYFAEKPFLKWKNSNITITMAHAPWILGSGSWFKEFYLKQISEKNTIPIYSSPDFKMMFIDVEDCARSLIYLSTINHSGAIHLFGTKPIFYYEFIEQLKYYFPLCEIEKIELNRYEKAIQEAFQVEILLDTKYHGLHEELPIRWRLPDELIRRHSGRLMKDK